MGNLNVIPKFTDLLVDPGKVALLPPESIPAVLGELERLRATLWARLTLTQSNGGHEDSSSDGDRLLSAKEAAAKLGSSSDWLYRHSRSLPFTVRMGRRVQFSEAGIERYIRQRMGR